MLTEHGMMARPYPDVRANTVSSFALGDYEWILAFEADELAPDRRPDAGSPRRRRPPAHPRGSAVLHRPASRTPRNPLPLVARAALSVSHVYVGNRHCTQEVTWVQRQETGSSAGTSD